MVTTFWASTCVFNKLYLENLLALLRHTFPVTTFSRVEIYWLVLPWGHDQSTVSVLAGYDRGHVCNLGTTLTKYFQKDKLVSQYYECYMMTSSNGNIFSRYWSFVRGIYLSPKDSAHRGQWKGALIYFYLRINKRLKANSRDDGASIVATYWPSACVFNELYLENLLALLRHTFPSTTLFGLIFTDRLWPWSRVQFRDQSH